MNASPTSALLQHYRRLAQSPDTAERELAREQLRRLSGHRTAPAAEPQTRPENGNGIDLLAMIERTIGSLQARTNGSHVGPCPWHASRSGMCLVVWPAEGRWWCSSCLRGGDTVRWLALFDGISTAIARQRLGLPPVAVPSQRRQPPAHARLLPDEWRPSVPTLPDEWRPGDPLPGGSSRP